MDKKIMISGYYGFKNIGDEAILEAIINTLSSLNSSWEVIVLSHNPKQTTKIFKVRSVSRRNYIEIYTHLRTIDLLISGGGGLLQDYTSLGSLIYYLSIIYLAKKLKKKVMIYAQGIGPLNSKVGKFLVRFVLSQVDLITLRDEGSKQILEGLNIRRPPIYITADPVFNLKSVREERIDEILNMENLSFPASASSPLIGISLREWEGLNKEQVAEVGDYLAREWKAEIVFLPMQPQDLVVCQEVSAKMKEPSKIIKGEYLPSEWLGIISKFNLILGMRLHCLIMAMVASVPLLGIVYDPKVQEFLKLTSVPMSALNFSQKTEDWLILIHHTYQRREKIKETFKEKVLELQKKADENTRYLQELIGEKNEEDY